MELTSTVLGRIWSRQKNNSPIRNETKTAVRGEVTPSPPKPPQPRPQPPDPRPVTKVRGESTSHMESSTPETPRPSPPPPNQPAPRPPHPRPVTEVRGESTSGMVSAKPPTPQPARPSKPQPSPPSPPERKPGNGGTRRHGESTSNLPSTSLRPNRMNEPSSTATIN